MEADRGSIQSKMRSPGPRWVRGTFGSVWHTGMQPSPNLEHRLQHRATCILPIFKSFTSPQAILVGDMFPPNSLPLPGEILLITDELLAPASFLLHRFLISHMKESNDTTSVLISVSEDLGRWKAMAAKSVQCCYIFLSGTRY